MGLDIRWPIGFMFTLIGTLLTITGLVTTSDPEMYKASLGINMNLWWGLVLLVFGLTMLILAWKAGNSYPESENKTKPEEIKK